MMIIIHLMRKQQEMFSCTGDQYYLLKLCFCNLLKDIDKQKKFGGGGGQSRAPVQPASYGTGKKSLGTR